MTEAWDWVEGSNLKQRELQAEAQIWAANELPTWLRIHDIHAPNRSEFETDWEYNERKMEEHRNNRGIATPVMHLSLGRDNRPIPRWLSSQQKGLKLFEGSYLCLNEVPQPVTHVMTRTRTDGDRGKCKYQPWPYDTTGTDPWSNKDWKMGWDHLCLETSWLGLTHKLDIWETMLSSQSIIETVKVSPLRLSRESLLDSVDLVWLHTTLEEAIRFSSASLKWLP